MPSIIIPAEPSPIEIDLRETALVVIDMQKDFVRRGGYGESLGNNPDILARTIVPIQAMLKAAREHGMLIVHTREGHLPDLSDCPPTKLSRWPKGRRIGDMGPMGRILIRGEEGHAIIDEVAPLASEFVIDKPGKNAFYKTDLEEVLRKNNIVNLIGPASRRMCVARQLSRERMIEGLMRSSSRIAWHPTAKLVTSQPSISSKPKAASSAGSLTRRKSSKHFLL